MSDGLDEDPLYDLEDDDENGEYTVTATNADTGEEYESVYEEAELRDMVFDGIALCAGPCSCCVEPDGHCPDGWPSVLIAMGLV